jgi:hypothetical protein
MAILVVGGSNRGVGKTALVCGLIVGLPEFRWAAVKITSDDHGHPAPIWEEAEAGQGTDTARYLAAGAKRAFLIKASDSEMKERLADLERMLGPEHSVIYESNRVVDFIKPDLFLVVDDLRSEQPSKPWFPRIEAFADARVSQGSGDSVNAGSKSGGGGADDARPRFQLVAFERISDEMRKWLRQRISVPRVPE